MKKFILPALLLIAVVFIGFQNRDFLQNSVQRIDFTQHCLNSYLQKLVDIDGKSL